MVDILLTSSMTNHLKIPRSPLLVCLCFFCFVRNAYSEHWTVNMQLCFLLCNCVLCDEGLDKQAEAIIFNYSSFKSLIPV